MNINLIDVNCPICGNKKKVVLKESTYNPDITKEELLSYYKSSSDTQLRESVVKCTSCGTIFLSYRPKDEIIIQSYSNAEDNTFIRQNKFRIKTFQDNLKKISKKFWKINNRSPKSILDIGCAGGAFPKAADNLGFNVVGIEPSKYLANWAKENYGIDIRQGVLSDHQFDDNTFDIVSMWDVIEHLSDPVSELKLMRKILKKDGILVVNFPDVSTFPCKIMGWKWPFFLSVHLIYFTKKTLANFLKNSGYKVISITPYWQSLSLRYVLLRASKIYGFFKIFVKIVDLLGIGNLPFSYYIGQTQVLAQKN